jgi:hypothetical protein
MVTITHDPHVLPELLVPPLPAMFKGSAFIGAPVRNSCRRFRTSAPAGASVVAWRADWADWGYLPRLWPCFFYFLVICHSYAKSPLLIYIYICKMYLIIYTSMYYKSSINGKFAITMSNYIPTGCYKWWSVEVIMMWQDMTMLTMNGHTGIQEDYWLYSGLNCVCVCHMFWNCSSNFGSREFPKCWMLAQYNALSVIIPYL